VLLPGALDGALAALEQERVVLEPESPHPRREPPMKQLWLLEESQPEPQSAEAAWAMN